MTGRVRGISPYLESGWVASAMSKPRMSCRLQTLGPTVHTVETKRSLNWELESAVRLGGDLSLGWYLVEWMPVHKQLSFRAEGTTKIKSEKKWSQTNLAMMSFVDRRSLSGSMSRQVWRALYQRIDNPSEHGLKMSVGEEDLASEA